MFDTRIEILEYTEERDEYNDLTKSLRRVAVCYAQRTEADGRENLFAGRILHENEIAYTIRWRPGIRPSYQVREGDTVYRIVSVHEEGRRKYLHMKVKKSDADN